MLHRDGQALEQGTPPNVWFEVTYWEKPHLQRHPDTIKLLATDIVTAREQFEERFGKKPKLWIVELRS